jgi:hypothetical protein
MYGIQYLDYKVLVEMMLDNEPNLFENCDTSPESNDITPEAGR